MKSFVCTVLLIVGLATVSVAQQQVMQIRVWSSNAAASATKVFVNTETTEEEIELDREGPHKNGSGKELVAILLRYLSKGWVITTHTSVVTSSPIMGILDTYTLVKDE